MNRGDWITLYAFVKTVAGEFWFVLAASRWWGWGHAVVWTLEALGLSTFPSTRLSSASIRVDRLRPCCGSAW